MGAFPLALQAGTLTSLDAWREVIAQAYLPLEATPVGDSSAFRSRLLARSMADVELSVVTGSGQHVRRTPALIRRRSADLYNVGLQLRGRGVVEQSGRTAELDVGDLAVCDASRPYTLHFERDFEMLVLVVARRRLAMRVPGAEDLTAVRIPGSTGTGALTASLLRGLDPRTARPGREATHLSDAAVDLLAASLSGCVGARQECAGDTVVLVAQRYIDEHLSDPALGSAEVAAAAHVSVRQLQKIFERRGSTISGWIRDRRLERCWHDLADPRLANRRVAAVGASWGSGGCGPVQPPRPGALRHGTARAPRLPARVLKLLACSRLWSDVARSRRRRNVR